MGLDQTSSSLDELIGYNVNLYVGDETVKGKIVGVESDHVILENENNYIFYFNFDKINAITKNTKQFQEEKITSQFLQTSNLVNLLTSLKESWVTIVCLNKQKFNGILTNVDHKFASLICGEEKVLVKLSNISNVLKGYIKEENKSKEAQKDTNTNQVINQETTSENTKLQEIKTIENTFKDVEIKVKAPIKETVDIISEAAPEKISRTEKEDKPIKVYTSEVNKETKVWSRPIKIKSEPVLEDSRNFKDKSNVTIQTNSKESKQRIANESKKVSPTGELKADKLTSEVKETKTNKEAQKPFVNPSIDKKGSQQERSEDRKQKEPVFPGFRFIGEPNDLTDKERPSIFAGWPNRRNRPRF